MKHLNVRVQGRKFQLLGRTGRAQAATMVLRPGSASDDSLGNEHPRCEQWVYVLAGSGTARVGRSQSSVRSVKLRAGSLLVIEAREIHQIRNTGRSLLKLLTWYVPPAYGAVESVLASAKD